MTFEVYLGTENLISNTDSEMIIHRLVETYTESKICVKGIDDKGCIA